MPSAAGLRETSRSFEWVAEQECDPHLKHRLADRALALTQLAEKIEREERAQFDLASNGGRANGARAR